MPAEEKLKIFKDKKDKYHFKTKDDRHIDIEHKNKRLKFKLHKWNREASVEVFLDMVEADTHTSSGNKIEIEDSKKKIIVNPLDTYSTGALYGDTLDVVQAHDGGLHYDLIYKEHPLVYSYTTPLVCVNTRWSTQPFLTPEDIAQGIFRPINMEGGHTIYHLNKKNNKYMTGKLCDYPRPIAIDALGNMAWCYNEVDRPINPTRVTTHLPKEFMDSAVYPVRIHPDFGYTAIGAAGYDISESAGSYRVGSAWTMPAPGGTANYMRARIYGLAGSGAVDCKVFINQKDSGGAGTHGQIATDENLACAEAEHWEEFTLAGEVLTEAVVYILNITANTPPVKKIYYVRGDFAAPTAIDSYNEGQNYAAPESPWVVAAAGLTKDYSIYCNYTDLVVGWTGKISGVVDPAEIGGVAVADIATVKGVA